MTTALFFAVLLFAQVTLPPFVSGPPTQADRDLIANDPDKAGAAIAGGGFIFGCVGRASEVILAKDFADGASQLTRSMKEQNPERVSLPFALEGVNGDTCRVRYHGAHVDRLRKAFTKLTTPDGLSPCTAGAWRQARATLSCAANLDNPAYDLTVEREGDHIEVFLIWKGPMTP